MRRFMPVLGACCLVCVACGDGTTGSDNNNQNSQDNSNENSNQNSQDNNNETQAVCGNDEIEAGEVCDGTAVNGDDCTSVAGGFTGGALHCAADCLDFDTAQCCQVQVEQVSTTRPVDIIFLIDNSGSMEEEIAAVQNNINVNLASILAGTGVDYRVIMVARHGNLSADSICVEAPLGGIPTGGCMSAPPQPVNNPPIFYHYSTEITSHDSLCRVFENFSIPDEFGLPGDGQGWGEWLRPEAFKVFVELSDDGVACTHDGQSFNDADQLVAGQQVATDYDAALIAFSPQQFGDATDRNYVWHSTIGMSSHPNGTPWLPADPIVTTTCSGAISGGTGYQALSVLTGGLRFPSCDVAGYDVWFNAIAQDTITRSMQCRLPMPAGVDPSMLSLVFAPSGGPTVTWYGVTDLAACTGDQWYFDDNTNPSAILLCPDACTQSSSTGSQLEIQACPL